HYALPNTAKKGDKITVYYAFKNTGNTELENISVSDNKSILENAATMDGVIKPGEEKKASVVVTMGNKAIKSKAKITYQAVGSNEKIVVESEEITIRTGAPKLSARLSASAQGVNKNEKATLTLTLENTGKKDYIVKTVKDIELGEEVFTNISVPAGKKVTETKEFIITGDVKFTYVIDAADSSEEILLLKTNEVSVLAADPSKSLLLTVGAKFDNAEIMDTDDISKILLTVTNNGGFDAKNIKVTHGDTTLSTIKEPKVGESKSLIREVRLSQPGDFRFSAKARDIFGTEQNFDSETITVTLAAPTAPPEPTPYRTPPSLVTEDIPTTAEFSSTLLSVQKVLKIIFYILAVIIAFGLILMGIGIVKRQQAKKKSEDAIDHLQRYTRRDYTVVKEDVLDTKIDPDVIEEGTDDFSDNVVSEDDLEKVPIEQEESAVTEELPHEKYVLQDRIDIETDDENKAAVLSGGTGRYRLVPQEETEDIDSEETMEAENTQETDASKEIEEIEPSRKRRSQK
ncbi:MAG: hypothetical protein GX786_08930, partial [Clostridiales bacterium]|nr:hypothetical protein [Clostridiales bacterium]